MPVARGFLLLLVAMAPAAAQPFSCIASSPASLLRIGAQSDLAGRFTIACSGIRPANGITGSIQVTVNTSVTSRIVSASNSGSEALLLIGQPTGAEQIAQPAGTFVPGANVVQGVQSGAGTIVFTSVPIAPPGPVEFVERVFHVVNVRVNSAAFQPRINITMSAAINAAPPISIANPTQIVAVTAPEAMEVELRAREDNAGYSGTLNGCIGNNAAVTAGTVRDFNVKFTESFTGEFRNRNAGTTVANPFALAGQADLTTEYATESGFYNPSFPVVGGMNQSGLATQGTRLMARFTGLPEGVRVFVTAAPVANGTTASGITARLVATDANGAGPFSAPDPAIGPYVQLAASGGTAVAVWEVLEPVRQAIESLSFGVVISVPTNTLSGGSVSVAGLLAPLASGTIGQPAPSFAAVGGPIAAAQIQGCGALPVVLSACPLTPGNVGAAYSLSLLAAGGAPPYAWSLAGGALPPGLLLASNGAISGTPTADGISQFSLRVTDGAGLSTTRACALQIFTPITITTACPLPDAGLGAPYTQQITVTGGTPPYSLSIAAGFLPPGLAIRAGLIVGAPTQPGTFSFAIQAGDSRGATVLKECGIRVRGPFRISPVVLEFSVPSGTGPSAAQLVSITGGDLGVPWRVSTNTTTGGAWLSATPAAGAIPGIAEIAADARQLAPGDYTGLVTISTQGTAAVSLSVAVTMRVTRSDPPRLDPLPSGFSLAVPRGSGRRTLLLEVLNGGAGSVNFTATAEMLSGEGWLSLPTGSGTTPARLRIAVQPSALAAGVYRGRIRVRGGESDVVVPVSLAVSRGQDALDLSKSGLHFTALAGSQVPPPQTFQVLSTGPSTLNWQASATLDAGLPNWLFLSAFSGVSSSSAGPAAVQASVNPSGLAPGRYFGEVLVSAPGVDNSPRVLVVTFDVLDANANLAPVALPSGLLFAAPPGIAAPARQAVLLHNRGRDPLTFDAGITGDGRIWSFTAPVDRTVLPGGAARVEVAANVAGLAEGVYRAMLHFQTGAFESVQSTDLVLIVAAGARPAAEVPDGRPEKPPQAGDLPHQADAGGPHREATVDCQSGRLRIVSPNIAPGFVATAGAPFAIEARVFDLSGAPLNTGSVNAVLGPDSIVRLVPAGAGLWSGTLIPQSRIGAPATLVLAASDGDTQTGCLALSGTVAPSQAAVIAEGRVVSPASFGVHAPLSPGGLFAVLGNNLAEGRASASGLPLPLSLGGTRVTIPGAADAPLFFAGALDSFSQMNGALPYGLATNVSHTLILRSRGGLAYEPVLIAEAQPSVFTVSQQGSGQAIVVHGDNPFLLADSFSPVGTGQAIVVYCEGLGPVTPEIAAGQEVPADTLRRTALPVRVTVDGREAEVLFAGLTPGFAGLYQVNAVVPVGVRPGDGVELVVRAGGQASAPVTIAVKP